MKETFEIFPHGVLVPFKSEAFRQAHEDFDSLYYDLLSERLDQEDIRKRLESIGTFLHILYEECFQSDNIIKEDTCLS